MGCVVDAATNISRDVSRRDMATQMSPEGSPYTSPRLRNSISLSNSILPIEETRPSKADVRDVQVDDQVSLSRWSMRNRTRIPGRRSGSEMVDDWKRKALEVRSADWEVSEMTKNLSKYIFLFKHLYFSILCILTNSFDCFVFQSQTRRS